MGWTVVSSVRGEQQTNRNDVLLRDFLSCLSEVKDLKKFSPPEGVRLQVVRERPGRSLVMRIEAGEQVLYRKHYFHTGIVVRLKDLLRGTSKAEREAGNLRTLNNSGVPAPEVLDSGVVHTGPLCYYSHLTMRAFEPSETLWELLHREIRDDVLQQAGEMLARLHRNGYTFGDYHAKNMLVSLGHPLQQLMLIDAPTMRRNSRDKDRMRDIARFFYKHGQIWLPQTAVDVYLRAYFTGFFERPASGADFQRFANTVREQVTAGNVKGRQRRRK